MRHDIAQKESRGSCFYHNPSLPPSVNVGDLALAFDNMALINIELGNEGHFSLESGKMCQHFFSMIVAHSLHPLQVAKMKEVETRLFILV